MCGIEGIADGGEGVADGWLERRLRTGDTHWADWLWNHQHDTQVGIRASDAVAQRNQDLRDPGEPCTRAGPKSHFTEEWESGGRSCSSWDTDTGLGTSLNVTHVHGGTERRAH